MFKFNTFGILLLLFSLAQSYAGISNKRSNSQTVIDNVDCINATTQSSSLVGITETERSAQISLTIINSIKDGGNDNLINFNGCESKIVKAETLLTSQEENKLFSKVSETISKTTYDKINLKQLITEVSSCHTTAELSKVKGNDFTPYLWQNRLINNKNIILVNKNWKLSELPVEKKVWFIVEELLHNYTQGEDYATRQTQINFIKDVFKKQMKTNPLKKERARELISHFPFPKSVE